MTSATTPHEWTERESELYGQLAAIAVPDRVEQMATILGLLPFDKTDSFRVVELGCGEGALWYGALDLFPQCSVTALDISESMRARAMSSLAPFGHRATVKAFDLASTDWLPELESADAVLCALVLHHLADGAKQRAFADIFARLTDRGVFLMADIVEAQHPHQRALLGDLYDLIARRQSLEAGGSLLLYDKFSEDKWNFYRHGLPPQEDPAPLFDQLSWLNATGFEVVDCFWLRAGFGVYGGYKRRDTAPAGLRVAFDDAVRSAQLGLKVASRH